MADYYPLIARAVSSLDKSTGDSRRALYERARTALIAQLRGVDPGLTEADITRERLALEEAIRRVESEAARRPRVDVPRPEIPPEREEEEQADLHGAAEQDEIETPPAGAEPFQSPPYETPAQDAKAPGFSGEPDFSQTRAAPGDDADKRELREPSFLSDAGPKGFRDSIADRGKRGEAARSIGQSRHDPFDAFTPLDPDAGRIAPDFDAEDLMHTPRELPSPKSSEPRPGRARPRMGAESARAPQPEDFEPPPGKRLGSRLRARNFIIAGVVVVLAVGTFFGYREWRNIAGGKVPPGAPPQVAQDASQSSSKIADRVGAESRPSASSAPSGTGPATEVAQRVVLYEQVPNSQERKQYLGSVIWRTETVSPGPGLPPDVAIKADVEIPERQMRMSFTLQRNADKNLPASHTIQILFSTPPNFAGGGVADVPGVLMEGDNSRGVPLAGLRVKVTEGFFLIGLSPVETEAQRNVLLLKQRAWLQIPIAYKDGQHALLALEKGLPGDRVFKDAFAAWKE